MVKASSSHAAAEAAALPAIRMRSEKRAASEPATEASTAEPRMTSGTPAEASSGETPMRSCIGRSSTAGVPNTDPMITLCDSQAIAPIRLASG